MRWQASLLVYPALHRILQKDRAVCAVPMRSIGIPRAHATGFSVKFKSVEQQSNSASSRVQDSYQPAQVTVGKKTTGQPYRVV
jgi:hypothetical protein